MGDSFFIIERNQLAENGSVQNMGFSVLLEEGTSNEITKIDRNLRSFWIKSLNSKLHELTHFINELCEKQHTVGISVSITYENKIIYAKKITPDTMMSIQSISKK